MSKRVFILSTLVLSLGLGACQGDTEGIIEEDINEAAALDADHSELSETEESTVEQTIESDGQKEENAEIEELLKQAERQYEAEQFDAAAGTLSKLFQYDLSHHEELAEKAEALRADIQVVQAEKAHADLEKSEFEKERQSALLAEEYLNATGQSINLASDDDLKTWFSEKESSDGGEDNAREWTTEEAENYAFDQLMILENLNVEHYFFFVNMIEDDWVQLEAREAVEQDGVTWSNLIGLYRYNVSTDELQKLDTVTGEYDTIQNPS